MSSWLIQVPASATSPEQTPSAETFFFLSKCGEYQVWWGLKPTSTGVWLDVIWFDLTVWNNLAPPTHHPAHGQRDGCLHWRSSSACVTTGEPLSSARCLPVSHSVFYSLSLLFVIYSSASFTRVRLPWRAPRTLTLNGWCCLAAPFVATKR